MKKRCASVAGRRHRLVAGGRDLRRPLSRRYERGVLLQARHAALQDKDSANHRHAGKRQRRYGELPAHWPALLALIRSGIVVRMMGVEFVVPPGRAIGLGGAGSQFFHLVVERGAESRGLDGARRLRERDRGLGDAARRRGLAVCDPHVREFDETREFRQWIFGARLLRARSAQAPLEFVEVDLIRRTGLGSTHVTLTRRG